MKKHLTNNNHNEDLDALATRKMQDWKNQSLVDDEYFEKLPVCIQQRIKMNAELQITHPQKQNKKHLISAFVVGIAASLILYFQVQQTVETSRDIETENIVAKNNKIELKKNYIAPQKEIPTENLIEKKSIEKQTAAINDSIPENWETAMKEITNDELESMVWELDWEENF